MILILNVIKVSQLMLMAQSYYQGDTTGLRWVTPQKIGDYYYENKERNCEGPSNACILYIVAFYMAGELNVLGVEKKAELS